VAAQVADTNNILAPHYLMAPIFWRLIFHNFAMLQEIEMDDLNLAIFRQIQKHWCCVCGGVVPRTPVTGAPPTFWCVECSMYCTVGGERGEGGEGIFWYATSAASRALLHQLPGAQCKLL
jgi:hypothetical protein